MKIRILGLFATGKQQIFFQMSSNNFSRQNVGLILFDLPGARMNIEHIEHSVLDPQKRSFPLLRKNSWIWQQLTFLINRFLLHRFIFNSDFLNEQNGNNKMTLNLNHDEYRTSKLHIILLFLSNMDDSTYIGTCGLLFSMSML